MPEAIAIIAVAFTAVLIYVIARVQSTKHHPLKEREHLQQHHDWLVERLLHAEKHAWDEGMKEHLATQLEATRALLEKDSSLSKSVILSEAKEPPRTPRPRP